MLLLLLSGLELVQLSERDRRRSGPVLEQEQEQNKNRKQLVPGPVLE